MASKYDKTIAKHGHKEVVFVVTGLVKAGPSPDPSISMVLGVFTNCQDAQSQMRIWGATRFVGLDCNAHDIRYPLAKR
jgi:hypothetical protein